MLKATRPLVEGIEWQGNGYWWATIKIDGVWCYKHSTTDFWSLGHIDVNIELHPVTNLIRRVLLHEHLKMKDI